MESAEEEDRSWQGADGIEGLARLNARQDAEGAQLLNESWDEVTRHEDIGLCSEAVWSLVAAPQGYCSRWGAATNGSGTTRVRLSGRGACWLLSIGRGPRIKDAAHPLSSP